MVVVPCTKIIVISKVDLWGLVMTDGEKMVWASMFASRLDFARCVDKESANAVATTAIESAWGAVIYLRESEDAVADAFGGEGQIAAMLAEMVSGEGESGT